MTLIELMVALAIGAFLMIGAITVFMQSRTTFRLTDSVARLQENGRFVLDALEADIRMAGFWGLTRRSELIVGRAGAGDPNGIGTDDCGTNWLIDLNNYVAATNNDYTWDLCDNDLDPRETDTLVVRRVDEDPVAPGTVSAAGNNFTLYVMSRRGGPELGEIFADQPLNTLPSGWVDPVGTDVFNELHRLVVNGYYVSNQSTAPNTGPSLRMQTLVPCPTPPPANPCAANSEGLIEDREILSGVEDFQVQLGVDSDASGTEGESGTIDGWVNPGDAILANPNSAVLAVRVWLRIRSELEERGFSDTATYSYADVVNFTPPVADRGFRRIIVTKTIYLRNSRPVGG
jgi:type IV pilus assembly protein PilW